tara:strand:- start:251 stop:940 length:690 start_codon:yes stop_codon:yes gene_type:complete
MKNLLRLLENLLVKFQNNKILNYLIEDEIFNVIDVGGHHGEFYEAFIRKSINFDSYLIFEPFPESFEVIDNIHDPRIKKHNIGIGEEKSTLTLNVSKWETSNTFSNVNKNSFKNKIKKLIYRVDSYSSELEVEIDSLDNICINMDKTFDVLKVDVEGFELSVLKGAKRLFQSELIKYVVIEFQKEDSYLGYSPKDIEKYLDKMGFKLMKTFKFLGLGIEDRIYKLNPTQ